MKHSSRFVKSWELPVGRRIFARSPAQTLSEHVRQISVTRQYSSQHTLGTSPLTTKRKTVTVLNDNGLVPWNELSGKEKAARLTQQALNFGLIVFGAALSGGVAYSLYTYVFSPKSEISHYNRAFDEVMNDPECIALLGDVGGITSYGESLANLRRKPRNVISSKIQTDSQGTEHLLLKFNINGTKSQGVVNSHMIKRPSERKFEQKFLTLDVPGRPRIYLKVAEKSKYKSKKRFKLFGVNWN